MYKVIFHVNEIAKALMTLNNIKNLKADLQDAQVELLTNAEGVTMLLKSQFQLDPLIKALHAQNVVFAACANTLRDMNIPRESLFDFVQIVPSGVGELVKKQAEGYVYIKP